MKPQRSFAEFVGDTAAGVGGLSGPLSIGIHHQTQEISAAGSHVQSVMRRAESKTQHGR